MKGRNCDAHLQRGGGGGVKYPLDTNSYCSLLRNHPHTSACQSAVPNPQLPLRCAAEERDTSPQSNRLPEESLCDHGGCLTICLAGREDVHVLLCPPKAFDPEQYPVFFKHLYAASIDRKP